MGYQVSDKVKIKKYFCASGKDMQNGMWKWAGKTMTVRCASDSWYYMVEDHYDGCGFLWSDEMIEGLADPAEEAFVKAQVDEAEKKAREEWATGEIEMISAAHKIGGKLYLWQNPDGIEVKRGEIAKVETKRGEKPVIVHGILKAKRKEVCKHKKVIGKY